MSADGHSRAAIRRPAPVEGYDARSSVTLSWVGWIAALVVVVMFIPIRRYAIPGGLPFELEPYRVLVGMAIAGWIAALLVDPRTRLRPSGLRGPLILLVLSVLLSIALNPGNVQAEQANVIKALTFLVSFILVMAMIVSVIDTREAVDRILKVLVVCGSVVALFAIIESRTGFNVFNELGRVLPLEVVDVPLTPDRGAHLRVFASAQHSIALSAAMVMLIPIAAYLVVRTGRRLWWAAAGLMLVASVATISRTGMIMLLIIGITFSMIRPRDAKKVLPIVVPLLLVVHLAVPGTIGALRSAFSPSGGLVNEQRAEAGKGGSGRVADLAPAFEEAGRSPLLGQGFGTRVTDAHQTKANILDDQWLGTLLETGVVGIVAWVWLFARSVRMLARRARRETGDLGLLMAALASAIAAFAVGLVTYDGFSFIQVTYIMWIFVALGCVLCRIADREWGGPPARSAAVAP